MWNIATTEYPDFPSSWVINAVTGRRWAWEVSNQSRVTLTKKTEILLVLTGCFEVSHWSNITGDILFWEKRQNLPLTQHNLVRKQRPEKNIILCLMVGAAAEVPEKWGLPAMLTLFSESQAELIFSVYLEFKNLPTVVGKKKKIILLCSIFLRSRQLYHSDVFKQAGRRSWIANQYVHTDQVWNSAPTERAKGHKIFTAWTENK